MKSFFKKSFFTAIACFTFTSWSFSQSQYYDEIYNQLQVDLSDSINIKSVSNLNSTVATNTTDSLALVDLYNSTNGAQWKSKQGWLNDPVYAWYGIGVTDGRVTKIDLEDNNLSGSIPSSIGNLTELLSLDLSENNLTGNIPSEMGNLIKLEGNINQSGILTYTYSEALKLSDNNLSGNIPSELGKLTKVKNLDVSNNNLTGSIPKELGQLYQLIGLELNGNYLTGSIPEELGNISNLSNLILHDNNLSGEIPEELGNIDSLISFTAALNNLTGIIPPDIFYSGNLVMLTLDQNDFEGPLPSSMALPNFGILTLSSNQFTEIPQLSIYENLPFGLKTTVAVDSNKFDFSDLEPLTDIGVDSFRYVPQKPLKLKKEIVGDKIKLSMEAGGTQTSYQWYYDSIAIGGATNNIYEVEPEDEIQKYHCEATNSLLPRLTLTAGLPKEGKSCWEVGALEFCLNRGTWGKGEGEHKITTTEQLSINNFLNFDGTMTIDTAALEVAAVGEFYISDIPVPGGSIGKYTVGKGEYGLKLLGEDGKITDFLNSKLEDSPEIFGVELKITDLQLVGGRNASGIKMGCSIKIPGIAGGCGDSDETETEVKLDGLEITHAGISLGGVEINDLGMYFDDYCLKNLTLNYDSQKDILISGAQLAFPFGEIGGGLKLEEGLIDSIAWNIEASTPPFVLGSTTIGIKGFFGHISNITKPAVEIELGGIFSDIISDDFYRVTASGRTVWPTVFEVKGTGQFLRPVFDDLPFQLKGEVAMAYDIPNELFQIDFNGNFGTTDEETWLLQGDGVFKLCHRYNPPTLGGGLNGKLTVSEISADWPLSWVSCMFDMPVSLQSNNRFVYGNNKLIYGTTVFESKGFGPYSLKYVIDLSKNPEDEDYLVWTANIETKSAVLAEKSGNNTVKSSTTFNIPENTEYVVFGIEGDNALPVSTLFSPDDVEFSNSSIDDNILYSESEERNQGFWSVMSPKAGDWSIQLENPNDNDSVFVFIKQKEVDFEFTVNQTGNEVQVTWDDTNVEAEDEVAVFLDDNLSDFDGIPVANAQASTGNLNFTMDETLPDCSYYLFAQLSDGFTMRQAYAENAIQNSLGALSPPDNFSAFLNEETGMMEFSWTNNNSGDVKGYIISIINKNGNDSVYAILNHDDTSVSFLVEDYQEKSAKIEAFDAEWNIGCPATVRSFSTNIDNSFKNRFAEQNLKVYPNPTSGNCTIEFYVSKDSDCQIIVFDINGRVVSIPWNGHKNAGVHQLTFNYNKLPEGMYLIKYVSNQESFTVKSIFSR